MGQSVIGLIGAMDEEIEYFLQHVTHLETVSKAGIIFRSGERYGKKIVFCKCGVGKVNAAVCTQILIDLYQAEVVLFTGVAGALHPELNIGDLVVSTDCVQHDMDVTALGFPKGTIPFAPESVFAADPEWIERALSAGEELFPGKLRKGRILSGDQFIASPDKGKELREQLQGDCVEMEGAAVAQVCALNEVPFVILRSMSDTADGSAHANFAEFSTLASERSAAIVDRMLEAL